MHGKRYKLHNHRRSLSEGPKNILRIAICIAIAIAVSFALIAFGSFLGERVPSEESTSVPDSSESTGAPESIFEYKSIAPHAVGDVDIFKLGSSDAFDMVSLNISDKDGKLAYITEINSVIYGNSVTSSLKTLSGAIFDARNLGDKVSVCFTPFVFADNPKLALSCTSSVIETLAGLEVDEIVLRADSIDVDSGAKIVGYADEKLSIGALLDPIQLTSESAVRGYYSVFDFIAVDLTELPILEEAESETTVAESVVTGTENLLETTAPTEDVMTLEEYLGENRLLINKYSVRLRVRCATAEELEEFLSLAAEFDIESFEVVSE